MEVWGLGRGGGGGRGADVFWVCICPLLLSFFVAFVLVELLGRDEVSTMDENGYTRMT